MARQARLILPNYPHQVVQRGHNQAAVFADDDDRRRYLNTLREVAREHRVQVHAYVLMHNHVHLLMTPDTSNGLSRTMQSLGRRYVAYFNQRHGRSGTLWEGRFRMHALEAQPYLLGCQRYIETNPVRAGLVENPEHYIWSSVAHHLGHRSDPVIVDHPVYWALGNTPFERELAYQHWLEMGIEPPELASWRSSLMSGRPLVSERELQRLQEALDRSLVARPRGRPRKAKPETNGDQCVPNLNNVGSA